jgi:hypothetical protein
VIELLDWYDIYYQILEYKQIRGIHNIHIRPASLRSIIEHKHYKRYCNDADINPQQFTDLERVTEIVITILKKCINHYYRRKRLAEEVHHTRLIPLTNTDEKLLTKYDIKIRTKDLQFVKIIEDQAATKVHGYQARLSGRYLVNAYYQYHLYQPLLSHSQMDVITTTPTGLNEGETKFVMDLQNHLSKTSIPDTEIYLLRNLTRGRGVGFFEENRFFPDFIMWIKDHQTQKIVFLDPKGITHLSLGQEKLTLHEHLRNDVQPRIATSGIILDAYILSVTPFEGISKKLDVRKTLDEFAVDNHLIFMRETQTRPNKKYLDTLFSQILN